MKRFLSLLIIFIVLSSSYVLADFRYNGMFIKEYGAKDSQKIKDLLDTVPLNYYKDIYYIKFFAKPTTNYCGMYWINNGIDIYGGCWNKATLIHELAHHNQILRGDTFTEVYNHIGQFKSLEVEIWQQSY